MRVEYIAYDGAKFLTESDCQKYEAVLDTTGFASDIQLLDSYGNSMSLLCLPYYSDEVEFGVLEIGSNAAAHWLNRTNLLEYTDFSKGTFYWSIRSRTWIDEEELETMVLFYHLGEKLGWVCG